MGDAIEPSGVGEQRPRCRCRSASVASLLHARPGRSRPPSTCPREGLVLTPPTPARGAVVPPLDLPPGAGPGLRAGGPRAVADARGRRGSSMRALPRLGRQRRSRRRQPLNRRRRHEPHPGRQPCGRRDPSGTPTRRRWSGERILSDRPGALPPGARRGLHDVPAGGPQAAAGTARSSCLRCGATAPRSRSSSPCGRRPPATVRPCCSPTSGSARGTRRRRRPRAERLPGRARVQSPSGRSRCASSRSTPARAHRPASPGCACRCRRGNRPVVPRGEVSPLARAAIVCIGDPDDREVECTHG